VKICPRELPVASQEIGPITSERVQMLPSSTTSVRRAHLFPERICECFHERLQ